MNDTSSLPFLFVHGAWLWKVGVALAGALGAGMVLLVRAAAARRCVAAACAEMTRLSSHAEVRGTLRGRLANHRIAALSIEAEPADLAIPKGHAGLRAETLVIEEPGGRTIELVGPVRIIASAAPIQAHGEVPRELTDPDLARAKEQLPWLGRRSDNQFTVHTAVLHRLLDGDEVVARGVLEPAAPVEAGPHRDANARWTLRGGDAPLMLRAHRPRAPRGGWPAVAPLLGALVFAMTFFGVQRRLGESWDGRCYQMAYDAADRRLPVTKLDHGHPCVKASATSYDRTSAIRRAAETLRHAHERSEASFQQMIAVVRQTLGCQAAIQELLELDRFEQAGELARACRQPREQHVALVRQGRFEEAVRIEVPAQGNDPALPLLSTRILAGQWAQAANELSRLAELPPRAQEGFTEDDARRHEHRSAALHCHAAMLRHWAGDASGLPALRAARPQLQARRCLPMLFEVSDEAARRQMLTPMTDELRRVILVDDALHLQAALAELVDWPLVYDVEAALVSPGPGGWRSVIYEVLASKLAAPPADPHSRLRFLRARTAASLLDDDMAGAAQTASEAVALAQETSEPGKLTRHLPAVVRYYQSRTDLDFEPAGEDVETRAAIASRLAPLLLRMGKPFKGTKLAEFDEALEEPMELAMRGDATALVAALRASKWNQLRDEHYHALLPRVTRGREQLIELIRWDKRTKREFFSDTLSELVTRTVMRRELLQAAGLTEDAAQVDAIYRRFATALADRKRLLSLLLLDEHG